MKVGTMSKQICSLFSVLVPSSYIQKFCSLKAQVTFSCCVLKDVQRARGSNIPIRSSIKSSFLSVLAIVIAFTFVWKHRKNKTFLFRRHTLKHGACFDNHKTQNFLLCSLVIKISKPLKKVSLSIVHFLFSVWFFAGVDSL